jgi:general secretion pathway protein A
MYEAFYGLKENPFGTTPDPRYLYKSRAHREALAYLAHGIFLKKGFLALTGEVGVGKTTVVRAFMQTFHPCLDVSFVLNTKVDFREMLYMLLVDFGVDIRSETKVAMLSQLNEFLIGRYAENRNPVIVIDEAQNLTPEVLEELRMLSNLETNQQKLIQIVIVGQPELWDLLQRDDLRQLRQRIPGVCDMKLLSRDEVYRYIRYRLAVAGLTNGQLVFAESAIDEVFEYTAGIPRLINMLCDRVLLRGYLQRGRAIEADLVSLAAGELGMGISAGAVSPRRAAGGGSAQ